MYREDIDIRLIQSKRRLREKEVEYENRVEELEDLQIEVRRAENRCDGLRAEIRQLEEELINAKPAAKAKDGFVDSFIKCSYFCRENDERFFLDHVMVEENRLIATDGIAGIIVNCNNISNDFKNALIKWDTRANFEEHAEDINIFPVGIKESFLHMEDFIKQEKSENIIRLKTEDFIHKLCVKRHIYKETSSEIIMLEHSNLKVAFQKYYIDKLLMAFSGMNIIISYPKNGQSPLIVEGDNQQALFLPVFLGDESEC